MDQNLLMVRAEGADLPPPPYGQPDCKKTVFSVVDDFPKVSRKKRSFYGQADRKGGEGGSAPSALAVSKCENFGPIFPIKKW